MDNNGNNTKFSGTSWEEISRQIEQRGEKAIMGEAEYKPVEMPYEIEKGKMPADSERLPIQPKKIKKKAAVKQMPVRNRGEEKKAPELKVAHRSSKKTVNKKKTVLSRSNDDERKQAANVKKKRKVKSRIRNSAIAVVIAVAVGVVLLMFFAFKTVTINVDGESKYDPNDIIYASGIKMGDYVWKINREEVNRDICKMSPYIGSVKISVKLPSTVTLTVTPAVEKYAVPYSKNYIIVSDTGKVLSRTEKKIPKGAVELKGIGIADINVGEQIVYAEGEKQKSEIADSVLECAQKLGIKPITGIIIENTTSIYMIYNSAVKVYFGNNSELESKMNAFKGMLEALSKESSSFTGVANLSVDGKAFFLPGSIDAEVTGAKKYEIQISNKK